MQNISFTRAILENWGIHIEDIPTSQYNEADFIAKFGNTNVLIEEKMKKDDPHYLSARSDELEKGNIHLKTLPITRQETLSGIVRKAAKQLRSSSKHMEYDFRLLWFTATGIHAYGQYEQFISTIYGTTKIIAMDSMEHYRTCYYFRYADFIRRADVLDGAIAAYIDGKTIHAKLCLNALSSNYERLKQSTVAQYFDTAIEDPKELEASGSAFVLDDCQLNRREENPLLCHLQKKYKTAPLMNMDLGYTHISTLVPKDESSS